MESRKQEIDQEQEQEQELQTNLLTQKKQMIADYFFKDGLGSPKKKQDTSGSFGFGSSQFSEKNNKSTGRQQKNIEPSFFNESSIRKLNNSQSGQFIYFQNDSVLSELGLELKTKKNSSSKQQQKQRKKKNDISYSGEIQFEDSLHKSIKNNDSQINEYGTGKSTLPPTLKKPKFGFKISQTAESSAIMKDAEPSVAINDVNQEYQLKTSKRIQNQPKDHNSQQISEGFGIESSRKLKKSNSIYNQSSISSIKRPHQQPSIVSKQKSASRSVNGSMNFRSVFKQKQQKASMINSSLNKYNKHTKSNNSILSSREINKSYLKNNLIPKQVNIIELKDLRQLQNKLGRIKHQNQKIIQYMIEKDQEIQHLKKKKIEIEAQDPYAIVKENQLMKAFLNAKPKRSSKNLNQDNNLPSHRALHSAKSLKQISMKKNSQISSLHEYDVKEHKFKVQTKALTKTEKKFILSNRGMVLSQKYLDLGYSLKDNVLTLYLTLKRQYEQVRVQLEQNSFVLSQAVDRVFRNSGVGKQIKFKTQIKSTKCSNPQDRQLPLCFKISLSVQQKFENKNNQFKVQLPITVYNIAKQIDMLSNVHFSQKSSKFTAKQVFKTQTFIACKELIRNPEIYLLKLFPTGAFFKDENAFQVGFLWKNKEDILRIRIKERSFVIQGQGNPSQGTFELLRSIVNLLIEQKPQN